VARLTPRGAVPANTQPNKSLDASGGSVFRNLLGAAKVDLNRAAASTQTLGIAIHRRNIMEKRHALIACGKKIMNWKDRQLSDAFINRHGSPSPLPKTLAPGIHFRVLELNHENEVIVVRVGDVVLHDAVLLDWDQWQPNDRKFAPNGKRIGETLASRILEEAIRINPEQSAELSGYREQIRA